MAKFAFDSAIGNLKKIGVVIYVASKLTIPKVEKTCNFLNLKVDDSIKYGELV